MIEYPNGEMVGIFGPVASGKTYLIQQWLKGQNRFIVFDYAGEMMDHTADTIIASPAQVHRKLSENLYYFRISYLPGMNVEEDFKWVLWCLWLAPTRKLLICDEVHRIIPNERGLSTEVETMLRFARHANLGFIGASQRVQDVNTLFRSACRTVILFQTNEFNALRAIDASWGCADMVRNLKPLIYDDTNKIVHQTPDVVVCSKGKEPQVYSL